MNDNFSITEFAIVIAAQHHNPTILNPDFLIRNSIVDEDWELDPSQQQFTTLPLSQAIFKNGVTIEVQPTKITFKENVFEKDISEYLIPKVALAYVSKLPHVPYTGIGINPKGVLQIDDRDIAENYVVDKLLTDGPWKDFGGVKPLVATSLFYRMPDEVISIQIELFVAKNVENDCLLSLAANYHKNIDIADANEREKFIETCINNYQKKVSSFIDFVSILPSVGD